MNNKKNTGNDDKPGRFCPCKFFICEQSDCIEKAVDTQSSNSTGWILRETWCKRKSKFQSRRSVEFSRMANALLDVRTGRLAAADKDQKYLNHQEKISTGEFGIWIPRISRKSSNSRRFRRFGTRKSNLTTTFPYITTLC